MNPTLEKIFQLLQSGDKANIQLALELYQSQYGSDWRQSEWIAYLIFWGNLLDSLKGRSPYKRFGANSGYWLNYTLEKLEDLDRFQKLVMTINDAFPLAWQYAPPLFTGEWLYYEFTAADKKLPDLDYISLDNKDYTHSHLESKNIAGLPFNFEQAFCSINLLCRNYTPFIDFDEWYLKSPPLEMEINYNNDDWLSDWEAVCERDASIPLVGKCFGKLLAQIGYHYQPIVAIATLDEHAYSQDEDGYLTIPPHGYVFAVKLD